MIKTRQKTRKQISNLSLDIEIVNPIESKSLFGGCSYGHFQCGDFSCQITYGGWTNGTPIYITGTWSSSGSSGSGMDNSYGENHVLNGGYHDDWNHNDPYYSGYGGSNTYDQNNNGIADSEESETDVDNNGDGVNDLDQFPNLTFNELSWLAAHPTLILDMYENKTLAESSGPLLQNGYYDALRHALWSALDSFDIGITLANEFHTLHETEHWNDTESPSDLQNNAWGFNWAYLNGNAQNNMTQFLADFNLAVQTNVINIVP